MPTRAKLVVAVTLLVLLPLTGCGVLNKLKARDELNKGVRAYKAGAFDAAALHFRKAIEHDPELLNDDPHGEGWLVKIRFSSADDKAWRRQIGETCRGR